MRDRLCSDEGVMASPLTSLWKKSQHTRKRDTDELTRLLDDEETPVGSTSNLRVPSSSNPSLKGKQTETHDINIEIDNVTSVAHANIGKILNRGTN